MGRNHKAQDTAQWYKPLARLGALAKQQGFDLPKWLTLALPVCVALPPTLLVE